MMSTKGGQGRDGESMLDSAGAVLWAFFGAALLGLAILAGVL